MTLRILIALGFILMALLAFLEAFDPRFTGRISDLFLNVSTELVGIALTVVVVDFLLERRRLKEEVRRVACEALNELDHHVWVWQGGAREFDLVELLALVDNIKENAPLPSFTQNLFLVLGSRASNTLRTRADVLRMSSDLRAGLESLSHLAGIRDANSVMPGSTVAENLKRAIEPLARAAGFTIPPPGLLAPQEFRQTTTIEEQEWRHYGREK